MPDPVVITRPHAQAQALARQVAAIGRTPVIFPLLEIRPLPDTAPLQAALRDLQRYALVAFVSPNAIDAAFSLKPDWPQMAADVPLAVVGEGSRKALLQHGIDENQTRIFSPLDPARSDSETLLQALDLDALRGREVLIVRGESGRELLGDALRAAGISVTQVAAYRRSAPVLDASHRMQLAQLVDSRNDWIVTSSEGLRNLLPLVEAVAGAVGVAKMQQQRILAPHARIAETAQSLGFGRIVQTGAGDEGLLAALQSLA